jgi:ubiquinone/menaquinone biosynthesis C-methylase UbiE
MSATHPNAEPANALAQGFRNVDGAENPERFAAYLDAVAVQLKAHKRESYKMLDLRPGSAVLDVGCGTGDDARALAAQVAPGGRVVGIDISVRLIEEARARAGVTGEPVEFVVGDAHATGLGSNTFDGARVERCLQHVELPEVVITEMRRVVRTGGWIVAAEPDWGTLAISASDRTLTRSITRTLTDSAANGCVGRHLPAMMVSAGLRDVTIRPIKLITRSLALAVDIFALGSAAQDPGVRAAYKPERIRAWMSDLERRDAEERFFAGLGGFLVRARVP